MTEEDQKGACWNCGAEVAGNQVACGKALCGECFNSIALVQLGLEPTCHFRQEVQDALKGLLVPGMGKPKEQPAVPPTRTYAQQRRKAGRPPAPSAPTEMRSNSEETKRLREENEELRLTLEMIRRLIK